MKPKTISWRDQKALKTITEKLLDGVLTKSLIEHFRLNRPEYFVSDDSSWLKDAILEVHGIDIDDPFEYLANKIRKDIKFIRAYHGCKPNDLTPYHETGLVPLDSNDFISATMKRFESFQVTETMIKEAIDEISTEYREGYTWFVLDDRLFFEGAGHYLVYGGELLQSVAVHIQIKHGKPIHNHLEENGIPTVLVCDIPVELIPMSTLRGLAGKMFLNYFEIILKNRKNDFGLNFGFYIKEILRAKFIVNHYHPKEIENPIFQRIIYRPKVTKCEFCD